ncbi:MAG: hypothetical protein SFX19_05825 [Alphaproteobacteria bacterium]|nr:hypothetical protein [Alphaproteobacteria bacterium]
MADEDRIARWKHNIERLTQEAMNGDDSILAPSIANIGQTTESSLLALSAQRERAGQKPLTKEEAHNKIAASQKQHIDTLKKTLLDVANGRTPQEMDMGTLSAFAGTAQNVASSVGSGNWLSAVMSLPGLSILPAIGDFFKAFTRMFTDEAKPNDKRGWFERFNDKWAEESNMRNLAPIAKNIGVDVGTLLQELEKPVPKAEAPKAPTAASNPVAAQAEATAAKPATPVVNTTGPDTPPAGNPVPSQPAPVPPPPAPAAATPAP